jgi:membrane protein YdbS with pleckstrin-like domain
MYQRLTSLVLRGLRVPQEPQPPHGDPASLRVFRAGRNFFRLRLFRWGLTQLVALAGIIFWVTIFIDVDHAVQKRREAQPAPVPPTSARNFDEYVKKAVAAQIAKETPDTPPVASGAKAPPRRRNQITGLAGMKWMLVEVGIWLPSWAFPVLWALKIAGILAYLTQLPVTYVIARLDYELRWYMVTDRSLRIRHGVWKVGESTMSFANIQQVVVSQGPLQRLLGLADVRVQSAGGGGGEREHKQGTEDDMHHGLFHSVTNAPEIRDLILERLRHFRQAGLGDPDDHHDHPAAPAPDSPANALAAAHELLAEARALRATLS